MFTDGKHRSDAPQTPIDLLEIPQQVTDHVGLHAKGRKRAFDIGDSDLLDHQPFDFSGFEVGTSEGGQGRFEVFYGLRAELRGDYNSAGLGTERANGGAASADVHRRNGALDYQSRWGRGYCYVAGVGGD